MRLDYEAVAKSDSDKGIIGVGYGRYGIGGYGEAWNRPPFAFRAVNPEQIYEGYSASNNNNLDVINLSNTGDIRKDVEELTASAVIAAREVGEQADTMKKMVRVNYIFLLSIILIIISVLLSSS